MAAGCNETIEHAEAARPRYSPGQHVLAAHAVLESRLPFENEHLAALSSENGGQSRSSEATSNHDYVDVHDFLPMLAIGRINGLSNGDEKAQPLTSEIEDHSPGRPVDC